MAVRGIASAKRFARDSSAAGTSGNIASLRYSSMSARQAASFSSGSIASDSSAHARDALVTRLKSS
jgi:hypothetical protein